jgi:hypothetical protein
MASFKLNIARITSCPPAEKLLKAIEEFGLPETEEFGVLNQSGNDQAVFATLIRRSQQAVQRLNVETREVNAAPVERVTVYPIAVRPRGERLEVYAGSAAGIEQIGLFFASCLNLPTVVEPIEIDVVSALQKLSSETQRFQLRSVRIKDYAHNSYMAGTYAPKFLDGEHGKEFIEEYADSVQAAGVRFSAPRGRVNVSLSPVACFAYSCNEEDQPPVQMILRKLA